MATKGWLHYSVLIQTEHASRSRLEGDFGKLGVSGRARAYHALIID